ncbi:MAG: hypothetical protein Q9195_009576 [Heterodermia aff. obscurata]
MASPTPGRSGGGGSNSPRKPHIERNIFRNWLTDPPFREVANEPGWYGSQLRRRRSQLLMRTQGRQSLLTYQDIGPHHDAHRLYSWCKARSCGGRLPLRAPFQAAPNNPTTTESQPPSSPEIQTLTARFLAVLPEARQPRTYLSHAHWDLETAVRVYASERAQEVVEQEDDDDDEELSVTDDESIPASTSPRSRLRQLNPHIDRKPAIKDKPSPSKLHIQLHNIDGAAAIEKSYPKPVEWTSSESIRALNRWRQQVLRRHLGAAQENRVRFHPGELRFLFHAHRNHLLEARAHGRDVEWNDMDWERITTDFNNNFEGRNLYGDPEGPVRPRRTAGALRSVRARVWEITELTGMTPRPEKEMKKIMDGDEDEDEANEGEENKAQRKKGGAGKNEEKKGDRGGRRGSLGKK